MSNFISKTIQATMDHEARLLIAEAYKKTEEVLAKHKDNLKLMAEALLSKETLNYDDVEKLLGPPPHGKKHLVTPVDFENSLNEQSKLGGEVSGGISSEQH
jgi:spastic paraplegia protein 7